MDTDDLSKEAYFGIIVEAENFSHELVLQFGVIADECKDEDAYLENCLELINIINNANLRTLSEIFFDNLPNLSALKKALNKIKSNIEEVKRIPFSKRTFEFDY